MSLKKVLAILLAVCMIVPMAACGENKTPNGDGTATTTVNQNAEVTDGNGEDVTTTVGEGEPTTGDGAEVTDQDGNVVTTEPGATTTTKPGDKTTKGDGKTTATTKPGRTTTRRDVTTIPRPNISGYVGGEVTLKKGTTRADAGVDFGGKTFWHASGATSLGDFTKGAYDLFQKKYNGKIQMDPLGFSGYTQKIAANQAAGKVYDILFLYEAEYPAMITADCAMPITDYITTADLWKNAKEGGFTEAVIQDFSWNGEAYALGGNYMQCLYSVFYNKKIFKENRMDDPETLYKQGKWTWEKFLEMGQEYVKANPGKYFMQSIPGYQSKGFFQTYNTGIVKKVDGVMKENTADIQLYKAFDMLQKMHYGAARIADVKSGGQTAYTQFANGSTATFIGSAGEWKTLYEKISANSVFGGVHTNLGMVPAPKGDGSPNFGLISNQAYMAGRGTSDPRAAICFAMVESAYNTLNAFTSVVPHPENYKKLITDALDSGKLKSPNGSFSSSMGSLPELVMVNEVCKGKNISTVLTTYKKQLQRILDAACK